MTDPKGPDDSEFQLAPENPPENPRAEEALKDIPGIFDSLGESSSAPSPSPSEEQQAPAFEQPQFEQDLQFDPNQPAQEFAAPPLEQPAPGEPYFEQPQELQPQGFEPQPYDQNFEQPQEFQDFTNAPQSASEHSEIFENPEHAGELPPAVAAASETLQEIRRYSERAAAPKAAVPAAYPFSLLITGHLEIYEKEKLLDLLSRENMGIREVDLEPQFEAGRILIPRISEYAGVLLVQALRGTSADIRLAPSDLIFATDDTREESHGISAPSLAYVSPSYASSDAQPDLIPIVPAETLASVPYPVFVESLLASASLQTSALEAEHSQEFQTTLESLQRELRYKAYRKGAQAILNFRVQLLPLRMPSHYKLVVSGTAVRHGADSDVAPEPSPEL